MTNARSKLKIAQVFNVKKPALRLRASPITDHRSPIIGSAVVKQRVWISWTRCRLKTCATPSG